MVNSTTTIAVGGEILTGVNMKRLRDYSLWLMTGMALVSMSYDAKAEPIRVNNERLRESKPVVNSASLLLDSAQVKGSGVSVVSQAQSPSNAGNLDISPEVIKNSPVLQRWLKDIPDLYREIRNDPAFKTRFRFGYAQYPSTRQAAGIYVGVEDVFIKRTRLTVSADYDASFTRGRSNFGIGTQYYLLPMGSYFNLAPVVGYRTLSTRNYSQDGLDLGFKVMLPLSRTGAADISLTQTWVSPFGGDDVGVTKLSVGYALTRQIRLSTDIQKQNARQGKDSRVGVGFEFTPKW